MAEWKKVIVSGSVASLAAVSASTGIDVDGRVVASHFYGDGSNITGISGVSDNNFTTVLKNKLDGIEASADVTDTANVTSAGALMDSELTSRANVIAINQSLVSGATPTFTTTNFTDATNKRLMTDAQESKLDGIAAGAEVNVATNLSQTTAAAQLTIASSTGTNIVVAEASDSIAGLMSTTHHDKLDGISAGAEVNRTDAAIKSSIGTGNGKFVPAAGSSGEFLKHDGTFGTPSYSSGQRTQEEIEDFAGALVATGGTKTGITVTYDDTNGNMDFVVASQTDQNFTNADHTKLNGIESNATADQTASEIIAFLNDVATYSLGTAGSGTVTVNNALTVTGNLTVSGTTTTVDTANLNVTDQFINLNDGGSAADGGIVVEGAGVSYGWDNSAGRWAFDAAGATEGQSAISSDAFASAVVTSDLAAYRKNGNIRVESGEVYIYVE